MLSKTALKDLQLKYNVEIKTCLSQVFACSCNDLSVTENLQCFALSNPCLPLITMIAV